MGAGHVQDDRGRCDLHPLRFCARPAEHHAAAGERERVRLRVLAGLRARGRRLTADGVRGGQRAGADAERGELPVRAGLRLRGESAQLLRRLRCVRRGLLQGPRGQRSLHVLLGPRANRTACACAAGFEPDPDHGPDVLGGSCVEECEPGFGEALGLCTLCETGKFKASRGQTCSACPGVRSSSPRGITAQARCSCPKAALEIAAAEMAVVERLGPLLDESAESVSALGALVLAANASRPLWRLEIAFPSTGARAARVTVGGRLVSSSRARQLQQHDP
jgi:hypothetical protein